MRFFSWKFIFWQNLLGDDDEDEAFVFVQIWERTGEQEFKRFFLLSWQKSFCLFVIHEFSIASVKAMSFFCCFTFSWMRFPWKATT